ncbi:MarR family transcriptional regulator [Paenibacillus chitinolyticus]|uniref:MarR family transcriptional regulator n=1 Tax=Paenibacillus chitinolyticus TaxID=79263 RepID=A0A410WPN4_9BACL|nr:MULTISPECIES: MarR family transcriptional regulator [Paenibacillus]MCY9590955.1 MarR family transcriptional regulator [Paenibacillus chitinolyticus]MCY9597244.1 MarR family transcriptional regulator [Paenibacillus chitinolyticus]QAV16389.1 MarR family transcriptional regulator [Paenibacillus chitinolyticus]
MEEQTVFELIHNMDKFTNGLIIQWNKTFNEDLGVSHVLVLGHLKQNGKSRPSDLAKILGLTPPTLSYLSEKLVAKKLAVRMVDESDRRIIYLGITDKGAEVLKRATLEGERLRRNLFEKLTDEERAELANLFKKLNS